MSRLAKTSDKELLERIKHQKSVVRDLERDEADIEQLAEVKGYLEVLEEEKTRRKL